MAIERILKYVNRRHYHWYAGSELNFFRYPDEELLLTGSNLSGSDLEIIRRIYKGMQNEDIARKLFLSPLTIYTHQRNILRKTGKSNIHEVIFDLEGIGFI